MRAEATLSFNSSMIDNSISGQISESHENGCRLLPLAAAYFESRDDEFAVLKLSHQSHEGKKILGTSSRSAIASSSTQLTLALATSVTRKYRTILVGCRND
jgi:hypothetical protein